MDVLIKNLENLDKYQRTEVAIGIENGVDAGIYAKPEFDYLQMKQIRLGLQSEVPIMRYFNSKLRPGLMREIRIGLEHGVDISNNIKYYTFEGDAKAIRLMMEAELEKYKYGEEKNSKLRKIFELVPNFKGADIFAMNIAQLDEIICGLEEGLDVSIYSRYHFSADQMHEIRVGMEDGVWVWAYAYPDYSSEKMRRIRKELSED